MSQILKILKTFLYISCRRGEVVKWLSSWLAEKEVRGSIPSLDAAISEICDLQVPSSDMVKMSLKRRKSSKQPTNQFTKYKTCI